MVCQCKNPNLSFIVAEFQALMTEPVAVGFATDRGSFSYSRRTVSSMIAFASSFQCSQPQRSHRPIGNSALRWSITGTRSACA
jgi:hypothetical protein